MVVGLTGNYGMGKSTVLRAFRKFGAITLDADEIVRSLLDDEEVLGRLRRVLGPWCFAPDGTLMRHRVAEEIFRDRDLREAVEGILHPLVFEKIDQFVAGARGADRDTLIVVEIPLLFEKDAAGRFDRTITVFTDEETALRRLEAAGISRRDALLRLSAQLPIDRKVGMADMAIDNNGPEEAIEARVAAIHASLSGNEGRTPRKEAAGREGYENN